MKNVFIAILLLSISAFAGRSPGEITGYQKSDDAIRMGAGWYDMKQVIVSTVTSDTIKTDSLFGAGTICRQFLNRTATDGRINMMTTKTAAFISFPVAGGQSTGVLPSIIKVLKSGTTIDTLIFFIQKQDTTQR